MDHVGDVTHATPGLARWAERHWAAKSAHDVEAFLDFFSTANLTYVDATLGVVHDDAASLRESVAAMMPHWGDGRSTALQVLGGERGFAALVRNSPELFGGEIVALCSADVDADGRIVRWVDYWDSRAFGVERAAPMRVDDAARTEFAPLDIGPRTAPDVLVDTAATLVAALTDGDAAAAAALFTPEATAEDLALRTRVRGAAAIGRWLERAVHELPYGAGTHIRHMAGGTAGGCVEWFHDGHAVRRGITALALDGDGRITEMVTTWDGALADDAFLRRAAGLALDL